MPAQLNENNKDKYLPDQTDFSSDDDDAIINEIAAQELEKAIQILKNNIAIASQERDVLSEQYLPSVNRYQEKFTVYCNLPSKFGAKLSRMREKLHSSNLKFQTLIQEAQTLHNQHEEFTKHYNQLRVILNSRSQLPDNYKLAESLPIPVEIEQVVPTLDYIHISLNRLRLFVKSSIEFENIPEHPRTSTVSTDGNDKLLALQNKYSQLVEHNQSLRNLINTCDANTQKLVEHFNQYNTLAASINSYMDEIEKIYKKLSTFKDSIDVTKARQLYESLAIYASGRQPITQNGGLNTFANAPQRDPNTPNERFDYSRKQQ